MQHINTFSEGLFDRTNIFRIKLKSLLKNGDEFQLQSFSNINK